MKLPTVVLATGFLVATTATVVRAYNHPSVGSFCRRSLLLGLSSACWLPADAAHAVIGSKGCYQGMGEGCAELSENNEYIRKLQEQSAINRDRNEKEARDAYYLKNYPDWFASIGKVMIKKRDGSFVVVTAEEAGNLQRAGKIALETPRTKGGTMVDVTQKPILVFKE